MTLIIFKKKVWKFSLKFASWQSHSICLSAFHFQFDPWLSTFSLVVSSHPKMDRIKDQMLTTDFFWPSAFNDTFGSQHSMVLLVICIQPYSHESESDRRL